MIATASKGSSKKVYIWDAFTLSPLLTFVTASKSPQTVKFSKDGKYLAVGYVEDDVVRVLTAIPPLSTVPVFTINSGCGNSIMEVDFNNDSTKLLICGSSGFKVYTIATATLSVLTSSSAIISCKFSINEDIAIS